jgi:hypothetical protein
MRAVSGVPCSGSYLLGPRGANGMADRPPAKWRGSPWLAVVVTVLGILLVAAFVVVALEISVWSD